MTLDSNCKSSLVYPVECEFTTSYTHTNWFLKISLCICLSLSDCCNLMPSINTILTENIDKNRDILFSLMTYVFCFSIICLFLCFSQSVSCGLCCLKTWIKSIVHPGYWLFHLIISIFMPLLLEFYYEAMTISLDTHISFLKIRSIEEENRTFGIFFSLSWDFLTEHPSFSI